VAANLVVVLVVFLGVVAVEVIVTTFDDSFFTLDVVGFMKLKLALGVCLRPLAGLDGVIGVSVAEDVIRIGLDLAMLGVDVVGFILLLEVPLVRVKSCWLKNSKHLE
jgi:hypothetical protein